MAAFWRLPEGWTLTADSKNAPVAPLNTARFRYTGADLEYSLSGSAWRTFKSSLPGGQGTNLQYRVDGVTFGGVSASTVSGQAIALGAQIGGVVGGFVRPPAIELNPIFGDQPALTGPYINLTKGGIGTIASPELNFRRASDTGFDSIATGEMIGKLQWYSYTSKTPVLQVSQQGFWSTTTGANWRVIATGGSRYMLTAKTAEIWAVDGTDQYTAELTKNGWRWTNTAGDASSQGAIFYANASNYIKALLPPSMGEGYVLKLTDVGGGILEPRWSPAGLLRAFWKWDTATSGAVGSGDIRINHSDPTLATEVAISSITDGAVDVGNMLNQIQPDMPIYIQKSDDTTRWYKYVATGPPVDNTTWKSIPVTFVSDGTAAIGNNDVCLVAIGSGEGGGGGGGGSAVNDRLDQILNPQASKTFTMADYTLGFSYSTGNIDCLTIDSAATDINTSGGALLYLHVKNTTAGQYSFKHAFRVETGGATVGSGDQTMIIGFGGIIGMGSYSFASNFRLNIAPMPAYTTGDGGSGTLSYTGGGALYTQGLIRFDLGSDAEGDMLYRGGVAEGQCILRLPIGAATKFLRSNGTVPSWQSINIATDLTGVLGLAQGGTGLSIAAPSLPTNGQLLIGNGTGFQVANLTQGTNITITNSAGGISIAAAAGAVPEGIGAELQSRDPVTPTLFKRLGLSAVNGNNLRLGGLLTLNQLGTSDNSRITSNATGDSANQIFEKYHDTDPAPPYIDFWRAKGSSGVPAAIGSDHYIGRLRFLGWQTNWVQYGYLDSYYNSGLGGIVRLGAGQLGEARVEVNQIPSGASAVTLWAGTTWVQINSAGILFPPAFQVAGGLITSNSGGYIGVLAPTTNGWVLTLDTGLPVWKALPAAITPVYPDGTGAETCLQSRDPSGTAFKKVVGSSVSSANIGLAGTITDASGNVTITINPTAAQGEIKFDRAGTLGNGEYTGHITFNNGATVSGYLRSYWNSSFGWTVDLSSRSNTGRFFLEESASVVTAQMQGGAHYFKASTSGLQLSVGNTAGALYSNNGTFLTAIAPTTDGWYLKLVSGLPTWASIPAGASPYPPGGDAGELQYKIDGTTFGALDGSVVSGTALTLGGTLTITGGTNWGAYYRNNSGNVVTTAAAAGFLKSNGSSTMAFTTLVAADLATAVAPGSSGNVMTSNGSTWVSQALSSTTTLTNLGDPSANSDLNMFGTQVKFTWSGTVPAITNVAPMGGGVAIEANSGSAGGGTLLALRNTSGASPAHFLVCQLDYGTTDYPLIVNRIGQTGLGGLPDEPTNFRLSVFRRSGGFGLYVDSDVRFDPTTGTNATGDMYYRAPTTAVLKQFNIGPASQYLRSSGTIPGWSYIDLTNDTFNGFLATSKGGTGLTSSGVQGRVLMSTGSAWTTGQIKVAGTLSIDTSISGEITLTGAGGSGANPQTPTNTLQYCATSTTFGALANSVVSGSTGTLTLEERTNTVGNALLSLQKTGAGQTDVGNGQLIGRINFRGQLGGANVYQDFGEVHGLYNTIPLKTFRMYQSSGGVRVVSLKDNPAEIDIENSDGSNTGEINVFPTSIVFKFQTSTTVLTATSTGLDIGGTQWGVYYRNSSNRIVTSTAASGAGFLKVTGAGVAPAFAALAAADIATAVAPSTSGNVLTSNGSSWVSQAPAASSPAGILRGSKSLSNNTMTGLMQIAFNSTDQLAAGGEIDLFFVAKRTSPASDIQTHRRVIAFSIAHGRNNVASVHMKEKYAGTSPVFYPERVSSDTASLGFTDLQQQINTDTAAGLGTEVITNTSAFNTFQYKVLANSPFSLTSLVVYYTITYNGDATITIL